MQWCMNGFSSPRVLAKDSACRGCMCVCSGIMYTSTRLPGTRAATYHKVMVMVWLRRNIYRLLKLNLSIAN